MLKAEVDALDARDRLVQSNGLHVYCAHAVQIPRVLEEIGRLREVTFRAAGEGTGRACDIDSFDEYYLHLFLWDARVQEIVGAYRLGLVDEILASRGKRGLYTHSLFSYSTRLLHSLGPAIELGRSFVRAEYQRDFAPLLLLWRGIGRFVERSPQYAVLFGAVSISACYTPASRRLMVDYLSTHCLERRLALQVRPRRPCASVSAAAGCAGVVPHNLEELARFISRIEHDGKGLPVLLRQYLRLGGRFLGFSMDHEFMNALDGLVMVDLRQIAPWVLARYMGKSGSEAFLAFHSRQARALGEAAGDYAAATG